MVTNIDKYIVNLISEFRKSSFEGIDQLSDEEKILFLYSYYHYFNADSSKISDVLQGNVTFMRSI